MPESISAAGLAAGILLLLPCTVAAQWSPDSSVNNQVSVLPAMPNGPYSRVGLVHVGDAVTTVAWRDTRALPAGIYGQRLSHNGFPIWPDPAGLPLSGPSAVPFDHPVMAADGAGGFFMAWSDQRNFGTTYEDIYCERFDEAGVAMWNGGNGVLVSAAAWREGIEGRIRAVPDGLGGLFLLWVDQHPLTFDRFLRANRISSSGSLLWGASGVALPCPAARLGALVGDGAGGAYVVTEAIVGGELDLIAQRYGPTGTALWGVNGVTVCSAPSYQLVDPDCAISDGAGGIIVAWPDARSGTSIDVYAQRFDGNGSPAWTANGTYVGTGSGFALTVLDDAAGGALVVYGEPYELFAQRLAPANGAPLWNPLGVPVVTGLWVGEWIAASDGMGGATVVFPVDLSSWVGIRSSRLTANGETPWSPYGLAVSTSSSEGWSSTLVPGGAQVVAWTDYRDPERQVYAQRVTGYGLLGNDSLPPPPSGAGPDDHPVTFSLNGPVDPHTEGILYPRGTPAPAFPPPLPGTGISYGVRTGPVPQATGLATPRPGDAFDHATGMVPGEAAVFQSAPPIPPGDPYGGAPDGTNNQIVTPAAAGLAAGPAVPMALWTTVPPDADGRDNIDALSFGEDYFPPDIQVGPDPNSPLPPGDFSFVFTWDERTPATLPPAAEPVVISQGAGIAFRFSVDPWAIGAPGTAVRAQSGGADVGAGTGPWDSPGGAAGDIFVTLPIAKVGGVNIGGSGNSLVHDHPDLGLAPAIAPLDPMEDDLDALECVGKTEDWVTHKEYRPGSVHVRMNEVGPDLPSPVSSVHEPLFESPVFFSVTRNSPGAPFSAVRAQFVTDGGAAADIFVMVKEPGTPPGVGTNLLFIENKEIGLLSLAGGPGPGPDDYTDDLDGLILNVCPEYRDTVTSLIRSIIHDHGTIYFPWAPYGEEEAYTGAGMTVSITKLLEGVLPPGCVQVGFSVTTDAIGLSSTAVDWEAGPVSPAGGPSTAAGDIFYATPTGADMGPNYLWFDESDLGLDAGSWLNGSSTNLGDLADNLDGLDSHPGVVGNLGVLDPLPRAPRMVAFESAQPNPFRALTRIRFLAGQSGHLRLTVVDVLGRSVRNLWDGPVAPGRHAVDWDGSTDAGPAPAGLYLVRASLGGVTDRLKVVRIE